PKNRSYQAVMLGGEANSNVPDGNAAPPLLILARSCCRRDKPSLSEASAPSCDRAPSTLTDSSVTRSLPSPTLRIGLAAGRPGRNEDRGLERKETMRILVMELEQKPRSAASGRERGVGTGCHQRPAVLRRDSHRKVALYLSFRP